MNCNTRFTRSLISIFLITLIKTAGYTQTSKSSDYLVTSNYDTLYGQVEYINEKSAGREFHKKIRFTDESGKPKKYRWNEIHAFHLNSINYEGYLLNHTSTGLLQSRYVINRNGEKYFLKVVSKGPLSHYLLEWFEQGESTLWSMDLLKKEEDDYLVRATQGIIGIKKNVLEKYFADCPSLAQKINHSEPDNLKGIVDYYNTYCQ